MIPNSQGFFKQLSLIMTDEGLLKEVPLENNNYLK